MTSSDDSGPANDFNKWVENMDTVCRNRGGEAR